MPPSTLFWSICFGVVMVGVVVLERQCSFLGKKHRWRKAGKQGGKQRGPRIIWGNAYRRVTLAWRRTELAVKPVNDPSPLERNPSTCSSGSRIRSGVAIRSAALWWRWPGGLGAQTWPDVWTVRTGARSAPLGMLERHLDGWRGRKQAGSGLACEHYRILQR